MKLSDFDYELPKELIAQTPLLDRESSRLLVLNKQTKKTSHQSFKNVIDYLNPGDSLVLNDTRVLPARLYGVKADTFAKIETLLLNQLEDDKWEVLFKPGKKVHIGTVISYGDGSLKGVCLEKYEDGTALIQLKYDGILMEILNELGEMPLPPYIEESLKDQDRYQTVYAKASGSAAAPTAGLHFTEDYLTKIKEKGINIVFVTLHIGLGTFKPVMNENIEEHDMHSEYYILNKESAKVLNETKQNNKQIISVGTTSTRVLESNINEAGYFEAKSGWTDIFIYPPYTFKAIDGLITNFHLPKSTLLMLISAFVDRETILSTYKEAVNEKYRFFSFGDAMFIYQNRN